ncbi:unnamed protein product [Orchesella dallaii]|uniref:E3 ubiquitin-protein ligase TRIM71 n=1 Tax=Orchesella dallaii TaxID=48710 RepID=A0ABP1RRY2_9HEXA
MDLSFYENLVGPKFPSPSQESVGCSRERSSTGDSVVQNFLDISGESSSPPASATNFMEGTNILKNHVMESESHMPKFSLASVDVPFSNVIDVNHYGTWPWPNPMKEESTSPPFLSADHIFESFKQQQISAGVQDVIEFVQPPLPHPPVADPPVLIIFCNRSYCLTKSVVDFTIHVHNLPPDVQIDATMLKAVVTDPLDEMVDCIIRKNDNSTLHSFIGSFRADEDGFYEVLVGLVTPVKIWSLAGNGRILLGSLKISVSRTYGEESRKDALVIQCEFEKEDEKQDNSQQPSQSRKHLSRYGLQHSSPCKLWGLTTDLRTNNLFYTDRGAHEVLCVHPAGHTVFKFGQGSSSEAGRLRRPTGIAYDSAHTRLVIADKDNHRICFFTMDGQFISSFGSKGHENGMFHYPWDVSVSPDGLHIAVTDSRNKRVQLFDRFGNFLNKYSIFEKNPYEYKTELHYPRGISFDETGKNIYVTDFNVHNVIQIPLDFSFHRKMIPEGKLCRPQGITVDWLGNLLIVDSRNNCVRQVTSQGDLVSNITRVVDKSLEFPVNVTALAGGFAGVLDGNGKIYIF